ncbi:hypothetical protein [Halostella litorea]|uniref:hypothetical protein n=1 Tax=Halostella litorea TaxID=2528831 RepID=UPI001091D682|nr:hypothetical protein [Halostella litorea]
MKSGAGDDPFADDPVEPDDGGAEGEPEVPAEESTAESPSTNERADRRGQRDDRDQSRGGDDDATDDTDDAGNSDDGDDEPTEIPWVLRRSRVKEDRDNVHQFFLRDEYSAAEDAIMDAVADELDIREKDLKKLDVREAMVATADAEAIAATLSEWGYEYVD